MKARELISINVNGVTRQLDVDPATPLIYVLRNDLGLTAAKFGCGLEQCGACAVGGDRDRGADRDRLWH